MLRKVRNVNTLYLAKAKSGLIWIWGQDEGPEVDFFTGPKSGPDLKQPHGQPIQT